MPLRPEVDVPALLRDHHFATLKARLIEWTGLSYYADKDSDLGTALERLFPGQSAVKILERLEGAGSRDLDRVVEELTIGETFFFRHTEMFQALRDTVFPDLYARKLETRSLRIWSAGCSIGAEPYSLSILLREILGGQFADWSIQILGSDINRSFLERAERAEFESWALRGLDPENRERWFRKHGNRWQLAAPFRRDVRFRFHNLASEPFPSAQYDMFGFDLVICRNVMIYFNHATITRLADQFYRTLLPGGWLIVGHSEPHMEIFQAFRTVNAPGAVLYQRPDLNAERGAPADPPPAPAALPSLRAPARKTPPVSARKPARKPAPRPVPPVEPPLPVEDELSPARRLVGQGRLEEAVVACEDLARIDSLAPRFRLFQGQVLMQLGRWSEAEQAVRRCLYLRRDLAIAHFYLGLILENLGREDAERAFRNAASLVEGLPEDAVLPEGEGMVAGELGTLLQRYLEKEA